MEINYDSINDNFFVMILLILLIKKKKLINGFKKEYKQKPLLIYGNSEYVKPHLQIIF